jgi:hypothetical protein
MVDRLMSNARTATAVFITEDPRAARQLLGEKEVFQEIETRTTEEYFGRARTSRAENIEMSKLLLDIVRDLKRVNAHLAAAAYPILEGARRAAAEPAQARPVIAGYRMARTKKKRPEKNLVHDRIMELEAAIADVRGGLPLRPISASPTPK